MAYTPTNTHYGIGLLILVAVVLFVGWKWFGWFAPSNPTAPKEGDPCTVKDAGGVSIPGKYDSKGKCIPTPGGPNGGPDTTVRSTYHDPRNPIGPGYPAGGPGGGM